MIRAPLAGQWDLNDAYRYISEGYGWFITGMFLSRNQF